jgi:hypothetical protein
VKIAVYALAAGFDGDYLVFYGFFDFAAIALGVANGNDGRSAGYDESAIVRCDEGEVPVGELQCGFIIAMSKAVLACAQRIIVHGAAGRDAVSLVTRATAILNSAGDARANECQCSHALFSFAFKAR